MSTPKDQSAGSDSGAARVHSQDMLHTMEELSGRLMRLARERRMTIATVESCTAGALAHWLSQAEGASDTLHGGFIVYTKANKTAAVGVSLELLVRHTAVSAEVAQAMARARSRDVPPILRSQSPVWPAPNRTRTAIRWVWSTSPWASVMGESRRHATNSVSAEETRSAGRQWAQPLHRPKSCSRPSGRDERSSAGSEPT